MPNDQETLLRVEHLCQYFGRADFKAVDDVSFDIKKGEVFGLVGESGCGKTTTGRAIIKLYNITSGSVYFKGIRIGAGLRSYQDAIKKARAEYKQKIEQASGAEKDKLQNELDAFIAAQKEEIKKAKYDQNNCDKEYQQKRTEELKARYAEKLASASGAEKAALQKE